MINALHHYADGSLTEPTPAELPAALAEPGDLLWLDISEEPPETCEPILRDTFGLHPLAVDDALAVIGEEHRVYFRDLYDHLVRLYGITESVRDLVGGILEMYLSAINNRMNQIMKTLTLITTLFMPISFIVGFFGMNFFGPSVAMPAWTGRPALWAALGVLALTPLLMYLWLRLRRWV